MIVASTGVVPSVTVTVVGSLPLAVNAARSTRCSSTVKSTGVNAVKPVISTGSASVTYTTQSLVVMPSSAVTV